MRRRQGIGLAKRRHIGAQIIEPDILGGVGGVVCGINLVRYTGKEHHIGFHPLSIEDPRRQAQDGVKVTVHHQKAAQIGPRAIPEQDVVGHDNGAAPTRFQAADRVFQKGHRPDPFARCQGEIRAVGVGRHFVEGRVGQDQIGLTQHLTLRRAAVFAADKALNAVKQHVHHAKAMRVDTGEAGRWRCLSREAITARGDNLDWTWLRDESGDPEDTMTEPDEIAAAIMGHLRAALEEIEGLAEELEVAPLVEAAE